jgi:hypothetical protein
MAVLMAKVARDHHPDVGILMNDPITGVGERQYEATDAIVSAVNVDVVGVNYRREASRDSLLGGITTSNYGRFPFGRTESSRIDCRKSSIFEQITGELVEPDVAGEFYPGVTDDHVWGTWRKPTFE